MNQFSPTSTEPENGTLPSSLIERLDPAIGETSTMMGAMLTELIRRTLRGSIVQIDGELQGQVAQKVDATIADRLPAIEHTATEVAEKTAREAATEVATEEVHALERRTKDSCLELASQIEETARTSQQATAEVTRQLTGRIEEAEHKAETTITSKAVDLSNRIEEAEKSAQETTLETARGLARQIEETERRANQTAQDAINRRVEELLERSRKASALFRDRLNVLESTANVLGKQLLDEASERKAEQMTLRSSVDQKTAALERQAETLQGQVQQEERKRHELLESLRQELRQAVSDTERQLRLDLKRALEANRALSARVAELEKPRGLSALWAWLFRRRKAEPKPEPELEPEPEPALLEGELEEVEPEDRAEK